MYTLTLSAVADVHRLKNRLRELCDSEGVRLGKTNEKVERILAGLLSVRDYNTLLGMAKTDRTGDPGASSHNSSDVLRLAVPRSTFRAKDRIILTLRAVVSRGDSVDKLISFFHQRESLAYPVIGLWVKFNSGTVFVFDSHGMNMSNTKFEAEVISLYTHLSEVVPVENWYFVAKRFEFDCCARPVEDMKCSIENAPVKSHVLSWREFFPLAEIDLSPVKKSADVFDQWGAIFTQSS